MLENLIEPLALFFVMGLGAGLARSDLRLPEALYQSLSIYLLLAIGLKGGVELAKSDLVSVVSPALGTLLVGMLIPVIAFALLLRRFGRADAAALAAHYGSVSAVTFAVVLSYLDGRGVSYEGYMSVLLVVLEIPAIAVGILLARLGVAGATDYRHLAHEVFLNKSVYLLIGGLVVGFAAGADRMQPYELVYFDAFKGALALFLIELGIVTTQRLGNLREAGLFLVVFGVGMPLISGTLGALTGQITGLSVGGTAVLATLTASASYIAAPAAVRIAIPEANPTLYLTASLGITFPFNIVLGIPIYYWMAQTVHSLL